jgi:hypothetical protein
MHNITFVNKANFVKLYNNFVLKWLIFALYVVVVPEQILLVREHLEDTLRIYDVSAMGQLCMNLRYTTTYRPTIINSLVLAFWRILL